MADDVTERGVLSQADAMRLQAFNALALKAVNEGNPGKAIDHLEEALAVFENGHLLSNYGDALARCGRLQEAKVAFERAMVLDPGFVDAPYNLGVMYEQLDDLPAAREAYQRSLGIRVTAKALNNLGNVHTRLLELALAEDCYRAAIKHRYSDARWNLALCLMTQGKWRDGWDHYEYRPQRAVVDDSPQLWRGEDVRGKTLLVLTEQGLGDSVFSFRYLPMLKEAGARLVIACEGPLTNLLKAMDVGEVIEKGGVAQNVAADYVTLAMSIPGYLTPDGTGPNEPYLNVPRVTRLRDEMLVGLCWNGSTVVGAPAERNIPLAMLKPLSEIKGVKLVSLQKGNAVGEMEDCGFEISDSMAAARDVFATAKVIASLDLVITIDTLIPHLSGAIGTPTWLMNRHASCWQWGTPAYDPHLYSTIAQFRQVRRGDWTEVVAHVTHGLKHVAAEFQSRRQGVTA